ncbi:DNA double-strand break repair protein Mre11 [Halobellus marinus]|uniref:DNA double-strand break repair protein Mre11 n=1 Tax=Halobellus TaxID=1073986 RepID=UPI0028AACCB9|nr:DNA double-strand break repair protein Mre11 [Halobellus sp. DFY28]
MTRVIHTGDTHIGYRQYHSPERRADFLAAFERVIDDAVEMDVDAVVHAGDLFHDRRPDLRDLLGTIRALRRLREADIPFLAVVGNHESTRGGQWLDLFADLNLGERLGADPRRVDDTAFYGLDHVPKSRRADLDYDFAPHEADHAVLVSHGLFTPFAHADWDTETVLDRANVDFDALFLGDNHAPGVETVDGTWVTYCGSTERASAAEEEPRGYNLVTFDDAVDIRRRTIETRPFVFVSVSLAPGEDEARVREQTRQHEVTDAVVVVEVTGEGEPVAPAAIEESLSERGALVARVTDRRERETDATVDVSFADPDDAVAERVRDLGLSSAALEVDDTVRESAIPDSNVRETVEERVSDLLSEGGDAFETAAALDDEGEGAGSDAGEEAEAADSDPDEDPDTGDDTPAEAGEEPEDDSPGEEPDADPTDGTVEADTDTPDGQVTMEDF